MSTAPVAAIPVIPAERLLREVHDALENLKAIDIRDIDVRGKTGVTDYMVIASGTSTRHVKSIADEVQRRDLGDAIVHIMLPRMRDLYMLEKLWGGDTSRPSRDDAEPESA